MISFLGVSPMPVVLLFSCQCTFGCIIFGSSMLLLRSLSYLSVSYIRFLGYWDHCIWFLCIYLCCSYLWIWYPHSCSIDPIPIYLLSISLSHHMTSVMIVWDVLSSWMRRIRNDRPSLLLLYTDVSVGSYFFNCMKMVSPIFSNLYILDHYVESTHSMCIFSGEFVSLVLFPSC